jgi:hypothetical protein
MSLLRKTETRVQEVNPALTDTILDRLKDALSPGKGRE